MNNPTIDIEAQADAEAQAECQAAEAAEATQTKAVTVRSQSQAVSSVQPEQPKAQVTAAQAKIEAVANLTAAAYARASELKLTPDESAALQAEFPDDAFKPGAAGKENLIYIEHAFLRDRLNAVIGIGQWVLIPRNRWGEDFSYQRQKNGRWETVQGTRIYVEAMLMVRGCFVAEAVGEMEYYPKNAGANYGDAVEGAKTAALRRCCKEFGIGLQAWKKDWCEGWWARRNAKSKSPIQHPRNQSAPTPAAPNNPKPQTKPEPKAATAATRTWMIEQLGEFRELSEEYFRAISQLLPNEHIEDLPLEFVPINHDQLKALKACIANFQNGDEARRAFPPNQQPPAGAKQKEPINVGEKPIVESDDPNDPNSPNAIWRTFQVPFGHEKGTELASLDKKKLFGWWANYEVETEYQGKPKKPETIAKDQQFRDMLDLAGQHYQFERKD